MKVREKDCVFVDVIEKEREREREREREKERNYRKSEKGG